MWGLTSQSGRGPHMYACVSMCVCPHVYCVCIHVCSRVCARTRSSGEQVHTWLLPPPTHTVTGHGEAMGGTLTRM